MRDRGADTSVQLDETEVVCARAVLRNDPPAALVEIGALFERATETSAERWALEAVLDAPSWESLADLRARARMMFDFGLLDIRHRDRGELGEGTGLHEPPLLAELTDPEALVELHVVSIELIGEDDRPIPGVRYRIELPDGRTVEGRLDSAGRAEYRDLRQPGSCKVTFPDLDADAWEFVDSTPIT